jgi:hypothetical protein
MNQPARVAGGSAAGGTLTTASRVFHPRCPFGDERCRIEVPKLQFYPGTTHLHACHAVEEGRLPDLPAPTGAMSARAPL